MATTGYLWDFGDGTTSKEESPKHLYKMPGKYLVTLTIYDDVCGTLVVQDYIYVYDFSYIGGLNLAITDKCFRHAVLMSQGVGWAEYNGDYWPYPEARVGVCKHIDENDDERIIVIDARTFIHYELSLSDWKDAIEGSYGGVTYESDVLFREHVPPIGASAKLKHIQSHVNLKAWDKETRNTTDYDENGLPREMEADLYIRTDSQIEDHAITKQIPRKGQVVFDRHVEDENLQLGVRLRGAPWRLPNVQMWFSQIDTSGAPPEKLMSEMTWSLEYSEQIMWIGRQIFTTLPIDFAGNTVTGSVAGRATGPDNLRSAINFGINDGLTIPVDDLDSDFSIQLWIRTPTDGIELFNFSSGLVISLNQLDDEWEIVWTDGVSNFDETIGEIDGWTMITLVRDYDNMVIYKNKELVNTIRVHPNTTHGGTLTFINNSVLVYSARIIPRALSGNAITYRYDDCIQNRDNVVENPL